MKMNLKRLLLIILATALYTSFGPVLNGNESIAISSPPASDLVSSPVANTEQVETPSLRSKIKEARVFLKSTAPLEYQEDRYGRLVKKQIALALLDKSTGYIVEKRVWVLESEVQNFRKSGTVNLTQDQSDGININLARWNSFNSFFSVEPSNYMVVGNKYLIKSTSLTTLPERSKKKYTDVIYIPYSKDIHTPEMIEAGKSYLNNKVGAAFEQLDKNKVISRFSDNEPVTSDVSKNFIMNIILVEHVDPDNFNFSSDSGKELAERVLVIIGANQDLAFRYTGSPAGANGMAQFIRSTYRSTAAQYPRARLIKDYTLGMANHVNAIEAMVLFFDNHKKDLDNRITRNQIGVSEEMLAAAYNGGSTRVARSVNKYGQEWASKQIALFDSGGPTISRKETINYLKKFGAIKSLGIF